MNCYILTFFSIFPEFYLNSSLALKPFSSPSGVTLVLTTCTLTCCYICDALRDLLAFVPYKGREKHPWRGVTYSKARNFT